MIRVMLSPVTDAFIARLRDTLPVAAFRDPAAGYLVEPRGVFEGQAGVVVAPGNTGEVARVIRAAGEKAPQLKLEHLFPENHAFAEESAEALIRLRALMQSSDELDDQEPQSLLSEAEALIEPPLPDGPSRRVDTG